MTDITSIKSSLRQELQQKRKAMPKPAHALASRAAAREILRQMPFAEGEHISLFWPLGHEIDTRPLLHALHHLGARVLLPRTRARRTALTFHDWTPELILARSAFGVDEPPADTPQADPTLIIAPLLGFDRNGYRLGYGAGHYDATLNNMAERGLHPRTVGLAFDLQRLDEVPREPHDVPLDAVVTETGLRSHRT